MGLCCKPCWRWTPDPRQEEVCIACQQTDLLTGLAEEGKKNQRWFCDRLNSRELEASQCPPKGQDISGQQEQVFVSLGCEGQPGKAANTELGMGHLLCKKKKKRKKGGGVVTTCVNLCSLNFKTKPKILNSVMNHGGVENA